jgi:hypothetical protein
VFGAHLDPLAADARAHAAGAPALEQHAVDERVADDAQVRAAAGRLEIAVVRGDARAIAGVDAVGRDAGSGRRVVVVAPPVTLGGGGLGQRIVGRAPRLARETQDRDRAVRAVVGRVREVEVGLHPATRGQDLLERPAGVPVDRRPALVVVGHRVDRDRAVDDRGAAEPLAAHVRARLLRARAARLEALPLELGEHGGVERSPAVEAAHLDRCLGRAPVAAGLEEHDLA